MAECTVCKTKNRDIARYCKQCGSQVEQKIDLNQPAGQSILGQLEGLDEISRELTLKIEIIKGMQKAGNLKKNNLNMILTGDSGTAKSLIGSIFFNALKACNYVKTNKPVQLTAGEFLSYDIDKVNNLYNSARGGMIIIDNAHNLIVNNEAVASLKQLLVLIGQQGYDPIIVLSGLPFGLKDYIEKPENSNLNGRFGMIFFIDNYLPDTMFSIISKNLQTNYALTMAPGTISKLHKRCDYLCREMNKDQALLDGKNGYLALNESEKIAGEYFLRQSGDFIVSPDDIKGPVFERKSVDDILKELDEFVGMENIKSEIKKIYNTAKMNDNKVGSLHCAITGNPGTGKTSIAKTLGEIYAAMGVLPVGHVVHIAAGDLIGKYIGHTREQTDKLIDRAMGGVLFIDEAYNLATSSSSSNSYKEDVIERLLIRLDKDRDKFCCIIAGYKDKMEDFYASNPGLKDRFQRRLHIEDYSADELQQIFNIILSKNGYSISDEAGEKAADYFKEQVLRKTKNFSNGRIARNMFDLAKEQLDNRLIDLPLTDHCDRKELIADDIPSMRDGIKVSLPDVMQKLQNMTGLQAVKDKISDLEDMVKYDKLDDSVELISEHFLFLGNPGTGKTSVAQLFADILYALQALPSNNLTIAMKADFTGNPGKTIAHATDEIIDRALGGVLFLDEAYNLVDGGGGADIITTLLNRMEQDRGKFIVIAAGYNKEMQTFLDSNSGLKKRFTTTIQFEDYSADELSTIFRNMAGKQGYTFSDDAEKKVDQVFKRMIAMKTKDFANAREARNVLSLTRQRLAKRIANLRRAGKPEDELKRIMKYVEADDLYTGDTPTEDFKKNALETLNKQIGLQSVKDAVKTLIATLEMQKKRGKQMPLKKHFIFKGNPGTGKTTIARIMADVFYGIGLLPTRKLIEVGTNELTSGYKNQTTGKTAQVIDRAMGGVLFIDEAYRLADNTGNTYGKEAIETLMPRMENDIGKFIVIAAGYDAQMDDFINTNPGLESRFSDTLYFEDYSPDELRRIYKLFADDAGYAIDTEAGERLLAFFTQLYNAKSKNFGNARVVRKLFDKSTEALSNRQYKSDDSIPNIITIEDVIKAEVHL